MSDARKDRILLAEDERQFAELTKLNLENRGEFEIEFATDGAEALSKIEAHDYDCIISDYDMPNKDGIELLEAVRETDPDIPFILFTGKGSEEVARDAISSNVTDYLQKAGSSDTFELLTNRVKNAIEGYRAWEALQREKQLSDRIVRALPIGLVVHDRDGDAILKNNRANEILETTDAELDAKSYESGSWELREIDGTPVTHERLPFARVMAGETLRNELYTVHTSAGAVKEIAVNGTRIANDAGEIEAVIIPFMVVGGQTVGQSRARLEALYEHSPDMIDVLDTNGQLLDVNNRFCQELGYTEEELLGRPIWDIDVDVTEADVQSLLADFEMDERRKFEGTYKRKDGSTLPVEVHLLRLDLAGADRFLAISRDISERKAYERSLERQNERLERLHRAADALHQASTREEIAEQVVEAAEDILDFPLATVRYYQKEAGGLAPAAISEATEEVLGELDVFGPEDGSLNWNAYESGTTQMYGNLSDIEHAIDSDSPIESLIHFPMGEHGTISVADTRPHSFDEADRFHGELLARTAEQTLSQLEREEELLRQREELNRQNKRLEEFASVVSHDLQNPLSVIEGRLALAREESDGEHLEAISRTTDRMRELIDDLLTLAREGDEVGEMEPVDLASIAAGCWELVESEGATLNVETTGSLVADRSQLRQLLENLFWNSVEHGSSDVTITLGMSQEADGFYVEDDGGGISAADRERVFEAGYSTADEGTGFGLAIVREIAEVHGWEVELTESESGGARFDFTRVEFTE